MNIAIYKGEKGITMLTLVITIMVLVIITGTLATNAYNSVELSKLTRLENDIKMLEDRVAVYYVKNDTLPITEAEPYKKASLSLRINDLSENDGEDYYVIDLSKLDNLTLNYGRNSTEYIINEESHVIYHLSGITYNGKIYHTIGKGEEVVTRGGQEDVPIYQDEDIVL